MKKLFSAILPIFLLFGIALSTHCFAEEANDLKVGDVSVPYEKGGQSYFTVTLNDNNNITEVSSTTSSGDIDLLVDDTDPYSLEIKVMETVLKKDVYIYNFIFYNCEYTGEKCVFLDGREIKSSTMVGNDLNFNDIKVSYIKVQKSYFNVTLDSDNEITDIVKSDETNNNLTVDDTNTDSLILQAGSNGNDLCNAINNSYFYTGTKDLYLNGNKLNNLTKVFTLNNEDYMGDIGKVTYFIYNNETKESEKVDKTRADEANIIIDLTDSNSKATVTFKNISIPESKTGSFEAITFLKNMNFNSTDIYFEGTNDLGGADIMIVNKNITFYNKGSEVPIFTIRDNAKQDDSVVFKEGNFKLSSISSFNTFKIDGAKVLIDGVSRKRPIIAKGLTVNSGELIVKSSVAPLAEVLTVVSGEMIYSDDFTFEIGSDLVALAGMNYDGSELSEFNADNQSSYKYIYIYKPEEEKEEEEEENNGNNENGNNENENGSKNNSNNKNNENNENNENRNESENNGSSQENGGFLKTSDETNIMTAIITFIISGMMILLTAVSGKYKKVRA